MCIRDRYSREWEEEAGDRPADSDDYRYAKSLGYKLYQGDEHSCKRDEAEDDGEKERWDGSASSEAGPKKLYTPGFTYD